MKAITANTYFYTRMMEMSQYKQIRSDNKNLQVLSQIIYQVVKLGIQRQWKGQATPSNFYFPPSTQVNSVYSVMMMNEFKFKMIQDLAESQRYSD